MELAKNPEFQQKARENVNAAIEKHGLTYEAFNDMKYLNQCIAEGIRLHPPVATIERNTRQDYQIPGTDVVLEKGTAIFISLYGLNQDPQYFKDPLAYNPERYNERVNISEAYITYGVGHQMCVGMKIGQLHAKVIIAMVLRKYEMRQLLIDEISLDNRSTFRRHRHIIENIFFTSSLIYLIIAKSRKIKTPRECDRFCDNRTWIHSKVFW